MRGHPLPAPRWKVALLSWVALVPTVFSMGKLSRVLVPAYLALPVTIALSVVTLTWLLMPRITRLARRWLYPDANHHQ